MQSITRQQAVNALAIGGVTTLAGCASTPSANPTPTTTPSPESPHEDDDHDEESIEHPVPDAEILMVSDERGHHFVPHVVWIEAGGSVTWLNKSGAHSATAYHPDIDEKPQRIPNGAPPWDSGILTEQDATYERTFDMEGIYDYYCIPHETVAMVATVVVGEEFDPQEQPGLTSPQETLPAAAQDQLTDLNKLVSVMLGREERNKA